MKLTVSIITYNHVNFITQAIESALMQQTNFDFEIIIGEDESNDGTREIVRNFEEKYPNKIRVFYHSYPPDHKRINGRKNFINNLINARGKYIALLEGDDYWTDPDKLQKQVDFLESNLDYAICFHNVKIIYDDNSKPSIITNNNQKETSTIKDLAEGNFIYTASCVFRNKYFKVFPAWYYRVAVGDWPLFLMIADNGKIKHLNETMAIYRVHKGGIWGTLERITKVEKWIKVVTTCNKHFNYKYRESFYSGLVPLHLKLLKLYRPNNFSKAAIHAFQLWKLSKYKIIVDNKTILKLLIGNKITYIRKMRGLIRLP